MNTIASSDPSGISATPSGRKPWPGTARRSAARRTSSLHSAAATAAEILWSILLVIVIVFLLVRGPALAAAAGDLAAAVHQAGTPAADSPAVAAESQSQELAARLARDENQLVALERKYAELKQRLAPPAPKDIEPPPVQGPKAKPAKPR